MLATTHLNTDFGMDLTYFNKANLAACLNLKPCVFIFLLLASNNILARSECNAGQFSGEVLTLGMSTALSGPAQYIGQSMRDGMLAWFEKINCAGGMHGYRIEMVVRDDGYQPQSALSNMKKLIHEDKVLAVVGNVGTPTAALTAPYAQEHKTPFFAPYTGAGILRKTPPESYIFNFRASYQQELEAIIDYIVKSGIKPSRIAFFLQDDAYGAAGLLAATNVLKLKGYKRTEELMVTKYPRNSLKVEDAIMQMLDMPRSPKAVIVVGAYAASAKFINYSHNLFPDTLYFNLSFTGASALGDSLNIASNRVFISQVVPFLGNGLALSHDFRQDMHTFVPRGQINEISFEGYIAAKLLTQSLRHEKSWLTRESIRNVLENTNEIDIGFGVPLRFSASDHQASNKVWLLQYQQDEGFTLNVTVNKDGDKR